MIPLARIFEKVARPFFSFPSSWNADVIAGAYAAILYIRDTLRMAKQKDRIGSPLLVSCRICPGILPPNLFFCERERVSVCVCVCVRKRVCVCVCRGGGGMELHLILLQTDLNSHNRLHFTHK